MAASMTNSIGAESVAYFGAIVAAVCLGFLVYNVNPCLLYTSHNTTPDVVDLQHILHQMVEEGVTHCVMEVSSHALALGRVSGVEYDTAVFTTVSYTHLDVYKRQDW